MNRTGSGFPNWKIQTSPNQIATPPRQQNNGLTTRSGIRQNSRERARFNPRKSRKFGWNEDPPHAVAVRILDESGYALSVIYGNMPRRVNEARTP